MPLEVWKSFFEIGGVVLLALTFLFGAGALIANSRLNVIQARELDDFKLRFEGEQQRTALAQKEAAEAKQMVGGFERDIATANAHAADARQKAEDERFVRVEMEQALAPRRLGEKENALLRSRLIQFEGQGVGIVYHGADAEGFAFAWDIAKALHDAKWVVPSPGGIIEMQEVGLPFNEVYARLRSGVEVTEMGTPQSRNAARALTDALIACGFDATMASRPGNVVSTGVQISVLTRPTGPQGESKLRALAREKLQIAN